jgi:hypothetical protein
MSASIISGGTAGAAGAAESRSTQLLKQWIEKAALSLKKEETKQWLQVLIIDPILNYIMERSMTYLMICLAVFGAMLLFIILTFVLLVLRTGGSNAAMMGVAGAGAAARHFVCPSCANL